jgi:hypothetical protein
MKKWLLLLMVTAGCAVRFGNTMDPRPFCQTAGWYVSGPRTIPMNRDVTLRIQKCKKNAELEGPFSWTVSDESVVRVVSSGSDHAVIRGVQYGSADLAVIGSGGQFTLAVWVE